MICDYIKTPYKIHFISSICIIWLHMSSSIKIDFVGWQVQVRVWREDLVWYWAHRHLKCRWLLTTSAPSFPYTSLYTETALCSCDFPIAYLWARGLFTSHGNLCRIHNRIKLMFLYQFFKMQSPVFICVSYINSRQAKFKTEKKQ